MNSSTLSSLLVTLCLILIFQSPLPTKATRRSHVHHRVLGVGPDLIDKVCNETIEDYTLCQKVLRRDSEIVHAKNFTELSQAILKLGLKKGVEGQIYLKGLAKEEHVPAIEKCASSDYDGVIRAFSCSLGEMKNDLSAANYDARIAGDGADHCDKALVAAHIHNPKIFNLNSVISMLGFMAFSAMEKIGKQ